MKVKIRNSDIILNIINSFDIEVHYEGTKLENKYIKKVLEEKKDKIYAITSNIHYATVYIPLKML